MKVAVVTLDQVYVMFGADTSVVVLSPEINERIASYTERTRDAPGIFPAKDSAVETIRFSVPAAQFTP